jgi:hypothetical protein
MEDRIADEPHSSRKSFLRRLGTFAAVGLGVALMPATARAQSGQCCRDTSFCPDSACTDSNFPFNWKCSGCGSGPCCHCLSRAPGNCFPSSCPCG